MLLAPKMEEIMETEEHVTKKNLIRLRQHLQSPPLSGNYFIMDSDQLVSRPLQELQQEAIESVKKVSTVEKITSVKNNVCEHALKMASKKIEKEKSSQLKKIHENSSKMRFEVKLLEIDKRKHGLELQQRMNPNKDLTYDENQIENTEKRLGVTKEDSFYLDKKLTYPLRNQPGHERVVTPFVQKARKAMRQQKEEERAQTARTISTSGLSASSSRQGSMLLRRGSKSAPPGGKMMEPMQARAESMDFGSDKLPTIHGGQVSAKIKPPHVKFVEHASGPFKQNTPEPLFRAKTYYPGMERRLTYTSSGLWDSDDEDLNEPYERIDLRALLFKDKYKDQPDSMSNLTTPRTLTGHSSDTHSRRPPSLRPPTQEHLKQENQVLRGKIDNFLGNIRREEPVEYEEQPNTVEDEDVIPQGMNGNEKKEKANLMLKIFSKPLDPSLIWGYVPPSENESAKEKEKSSDRSSSSKSKSTKSAKSTKENKNMWEFIRGRIKTVNLREKYTPNDLLLQQITGLMVGGGRKSVIPLNSASRALRYTPTFRMQQVLQDLIKQRTKYEQLEVNELKKKQEGGIFTEGEEDDKQEKPEKGVQEPHQPPYELKEDENNDSEQ
ncbi:hypothetical protein CHS0354_033906 [Potamilus streckersoni]|uniref:Uncharacterized protein n=1 Tax=Potamilus streckersoni TaxID=2493646 RepID=A0AAE0VK03_9BIVA|nr:hypothetical protein CHS0354_033906 [Potamilus streckersoni]